MSVGALGNQHILKFKTSSLTLMIQTEEDS